MLGVTLSFLIKIFSRHYGLFVSTFSISRYEDELIFKEQNKELIKCARFQFFRN